MLTQMKFTLSISLLLAGCIVSGVAQPKETSPNNQKTPRPKDPSLRAVTDDPKLPRVLLIGDSISMGYTVPVQELLKGKANVHRVPENGGPTTNGLAKLKAWLGER